MLHCYLALTVSQERCRHLPSPLFGVFAETHLSGGKELRVEVHTEENKKVEGGKKNKQRSSMSAHIRLVNNAEAAHCAVHAD